MMETGKALTVTEIMKIQASLNKAGLRTGPVDGVPDRRTMTAVAKLQEKYGLPPSGLINPETEMLLRRLMLGFEVYTARAGDSPHIIARRYGTTAASIITTNPGLRDHAPAAGMEITIPLGSDVVDTNLFYDYAALKNDLTGLCVRYPFLHTESAGQSLLGKNLYVLRLGEGRNHVFYNATHHALEWINSLLLMRFAENFCKAYAVGGKIAGFDAGEIWRQSSIWLMPMVNPDGVELVLNGLREDHPYYERLIGFNGGSSDFSRVWQANAGGVDLNHNYDAGWELCKKAEKDYGIYGPGPTRYSGEKPESEPESRAVADFTCSHDFRLVLAYHSQGREIYWQYLDREPPDSRRIGELFAVTSGYELKKISGIASYSGYKDWFIDKFNRPGYTIETGHGKNPLPVSQFDRIYHENIELMLLAALV